MPKRLTRLTVVDALYSRRNAIWVYYAGREFEGNAYINDEICPYRGQDYYVIHRKDDSCVTSLRITWRFGPYSSTGAWKDYFYPDTHWAVNQKRWPGAFFLWERALPDPRFYPNQTLEVFLSKDKPPFQATLLEIEKDTTRLKVKVHDSDKVVRVNPWSVSLPAPSVSAPFPDFLPG